MSDPDERVDRNIPDPEELRLYRGRIVEAAARAASEQQPDADAIWTEDSGPGSYRWLWAKWTERAPTVLGWATIAVCFSAVAGWFLDLPWLAGAILRGPEFPVASALMIGALAGALLLLRAGNSGTTKRIGQGVAWVTLGVALMLLVADLAGIEVFDWGAGSMVAPTTAALEFIRTHEPIPRGWYASPIGWLDAHLDGEFAVGIRSAVADERRVWLYAGAGIVGDSLPEKEWRETALKFMPMLRALGAAEVVDRGTKSEERRARSDP